MRSNKALTRISTIIYFLRGLVSLASTIILWAGVWLLCDISIPGSITNIVKQCLLVISGALAMISTKVFFSNAYMSRFDRKGALRRMSNLLREDRWLHRFDQPLFFVQCAVAMIGTIFFWNGVFNLSQITCIISKSCFVLQIIATCIGCSIVVYIISKDEAIFLSAEIETVQRDVKSAITITKYRLAGIELSTWAMALLCNACQVILWWGFENLMEDNILDTPFNAAILLIFGLVILKCVGRLDVNMGLEEDMISDLGRSAPRRNAYKACIANISELLAVVSLWTGFEWFIWDEYLFSNTPFRNSMYVCVGFIFLLGTDTFVNTAGVISPMTTYDNIHACLPYNEDFSQYNLDEIELPSMIS